MAEEPVAERGVLTAPTQMWETAVRQAEVIGPLAVKDTVGLAEADEAAERLGVSRRQVYVLLGRWRAGEGGCRTCCLAVPAEAAAAGACLVRSRRSSRKRYAPGTVPRSPSVSSNERCCHQGATDNSPLSRTRCSGSQSPRDLGPSGYAGAIVWGSFDVRSGWAAPPVRQCLNERMDDSPHLNASPANGTSRSMLRGDSLKDAGAAGGW